MFSELIASSWFNPWSVGVLLGMFILYPLMVWRDGYRHTAAYWLDPMDFSGPVECYVSFFSNPNAAKEKLVTAVGEIPPSKTLEYVAGKSLNLASHKPHAMLMQKS